MDERTQAQPDYQKRRENIAAIIETEANWEAEVNGYELLDEPQRYFTVERFLKETVWAMNDDDLQGAVDSLNGSDTERTDAMVYDLDTGEAFYVYSEVVSLKGDKGTRWAKGERK